MKKLPTLFLLISFLSLSLMLTSCAINFDNIKSDFNDIKFLEKTANEVVRCFDEDDADALKLLFCKNTLNEAIDIESQIEAAFGYYDGKSESHTFSYMGFVGCRIEGEWTDKHSIVQIQDIRTSTGKTYWITYTQFLINDYDNGQIGIIGLALRDEKFNVIAEIG